MHVVLFKTVGGLRLASESPLLIQSRRIALGDRTPVVLANLGSDRYHPGSLVLVLVRGSKHTWLGIQRRKRRATRKRAARSGRPLGIAPPHGCKIVVLVCQLRWREQLNWVDLFTGSNPALQSNLNQQLEYYC
jgi:hypothetical protein